MSLAREQNGFKLIAPGHERCIVIKVKGALVNSRTVSPPVMIGTRTGRVSNGQGVTAPENRPKNKFRAKLKSFKTDNSGYQNQFLRPQSEPAYLKTLWVLFLAPLNPW
jgi:hypothetical protein